MRPFDKRLLSISLLLHLSVLFFVTFIGSDSRIKRTFLAYGRHSRYITHAYFRRVKAKNNGNYQKYLKQRNIVHKKKKKKRPPNRFAKKSTTKKKKALKRVAKKKKLSKKKLPEKRKKLKKIDEQPEILHFNMMGEHDPQMLVYQQYIQKEVDRLWCPPIGVPKGAECLVQFTVDKYGKVKHFEITSSSKIIIYDLSIVRVAKKFTFHKCLWGKSFPINFRQ